MRARLKIPFAERTGALVHVSQVQSGLQTECICPACGCPVVARKGSLKVHHFAHYTDTNCQPETVAHVTAKRLISDRIENAIKDHTPLPITWHCEKCESTHNHDLVREVARVETEFSLPGCRPDICLIDQTGKPIATVEIVVTHKPEQAVREYCANNKITIAEYEVRSHADLERINAAVLEFDYMDLCLRPACPNCDIPLGQRILFVNQGHCWKCRASMRVAYVQIDGYTSGPEDFTSQEVELAEQYGAILRQNYSRTRQESYLSNTCPCCGVLTGGFYLLRELDEEPGRNGTFTGYSCEDCGYKRTMPPEPHASPSASP